MEAEKVVKLIEQIWEMQKQLQKVQNGLTEVEYAIAEEDTEGLNDC